MSFEILKINGNINGITASMRWSPEEKPAEYV